MMETNIWSKFKDNPVLRRKNGSHNQQLAALDDKIDLEYKNEHRIKPQFWINKNKHNC